MSDERGMTVLVVDDEPLARQRLEDLLDDVDGVDAVLTAASGESAISIIREQEPDLVFLDMQMPGMTGLDVVQEVGPRDMPVTIFVTAYDEYAVQAFEVAALDYLLKPFDDRRFRQAFERAVRHIGLEQVGSAAQRLVSLLEGGGAEAAELRSPAVSSGRMAVEVGGRVHMVPLDSISHVTAAGPYAELHTPERTFLVRDTMSSLESRLSGQGFFRIHRSSIVRLERVASLEGGAGGNYAVRLVDGTELSVSRARVQGLERELGVTR